MFEKTLTDVVTGIRASKRDTTKYISQCIAEIKAEINSKDMHVKANALQKLTFLQMMGYSMSYASFSTIEVMSSPRFCHKRIGYLAASQGFTQNTEVILLTTNLLKKELRGAVGGGMQGVYEAGLAINCLSNIVTEDLAKDLLPELTNLTSHPQPYLRKKAILCLFKLFVKYPQGLRLSFARLQQCLEDPNSSVVSCAVNVITELSDKNPKNYLHLAPSFFQLLTHSSNNWMLIKVVKLLGSLVPEEPRLARKLLDPLAGIVRSTQAKSLLYESVRTITLCLPYCRKSDGTMPQNVPEIVELCANTLLDYVTQTDQNLKYLGLVGFGSLMQSHPRVLSDPKYRPLILACLSDQDVTIRTRALDLLTGMTTRKNLMELVSQLLKHVELASGTYKLDLVAKIIEMCSGEKYALLQDFAWYLDVLFQIGHMRGLDPHGELLRAQVTDVALRVLPVRPYAVRRSMEILLEREQQPHAASASVNDPYGDNGRGKHMMYSILPAIAWIIGEYSDLIRRALSIDPDEKGEKTFSYDQDSTGTYHAIIQSLSAPANARNLPTTTQKVYLQAALKVFAAAASDKAVHGRELEACVHTIHRNFPVYMQSLDVEVVERSFTLMELLKSLGLSPPTTPGLMAAPDSSDDEEGDLLDMAGGAEAKPKQSQSSSAAEKSLAGKVRDSADTLVAFLKPSPMKPSGLKAQRKKRQTPIGVTVDINAPVNLSIFSALIKEEKELRSGSRLGVESVSFTQQKPFQAEEPKSAISVALAGGQGSAAFKSEMPASFQHPAGTGDVSSRHRPGDPFLLSSTPSRGDTDSDIEDNRPVQKRFDTIQLSMGSDDEADGEDDAKQRKKKKKAKKVTMNSNASDPWLGIGGTAGVTVYSSDDDDDDDHHHKHHGSKARGKKGHGREFSGLAKVDLTAPLREDEVMPQRSHRVVPDRPQQQQAPEPKKEKKKKAKKDKKSKEAAPDTIGDLLDLGAAFGAVTSSVPTSAVSAPAQLPGLSSFDPVARAPAGNQIDSAFDLLGLVSPAPAPLSGYGFEPAPLVTGHDSSPKSKGKRPWLKATVKSSKGPSSVDWSQVFVFARAYSAKKEGVIGAKLVIRVDNRTQFPLSGLSITFKKYDTISIGNVAPMSSVESDKVGPFLYSEVDATEEIKGSMECGGASVSVKIYLPASLHLQPDYGVSQDQVQQELMTSGWASSSASVDMETAKDPEYIQNALSAFLQAALVQGAVASSSDPTTALLAARGSRGPPVRFLLKIKPSDRSVKVDVKSTNAVLAKSLASDMKRLVLL